MNTGELKTEAITNILRLSASATRDHLTAMGVEL